MIDRMALAGCMLVIALPASAGGIRRIGPVEVRPMLGGLSLSPHLTLARPNLAIPHVGLAAGCRVRVTIVNRGPGPLPARAWSAQPNHATELEIRVDGQLRARIALGLVDPQRALAPGGQVDYTSPVTVTGTAQVTAHIDPAHHLAETRLDDNLLSRSLTCPKPSAAHPTAPVTGGAKYTIQRSTLLREQLLTPQPPPAVAGTESPEEPRIPATSGTLPPTPGDLTQSTALPPPPTLPPPSAAVTADAEPGEVLVVSSDMAKARAFAARLQGTGIRVLRRRILHQLGFVLSTLALPKGADAPAVLAQLRALAPKAWIDLNSRYRLLGSIAHRYARKLIGWRRRAGCGARVRIGLVDTGADAHHPALAHAHLDQREFLTDGYRAAPREHGTAEAAILLGNGDDDLRGLLPRAHLFLAAVFRERAHDTADATAEQVALALNWLVGRGVSVIVLPLGGPRNLLIEAAVRRTLQRSIAVTAAAGNGGPDAAPVYPAAQAGVIAVTAVDADGRIYTHANHGAYIDFAAPGVDLWVARPGGGAHYASGTSYATPFVGAALAVARKRAPRGAWAPLVRNLAAHARDLGAHGRDPVYGWGLLRTHGCARP